jgi:hypothetical protein
MSDDPTGQTNRRYDMWNVVTAKVWMSFVCLEWERERNGIMQHLSVSLYSDGMAVRVTCTTPVKADESRFKRTFEVGDMPRRYLKDDESLDDLFNHVFFNGKDC